MLIMMIIANGLHKDSDGRMFEAIKFTNGLTEYEYSDVLHKFNFIAQTYGLDVSNYRNFCKVKAIYKATN